MYQDLVSDEKLTAMAAEAARCLDPELYERGEDYYHRGLVKYAKVFGPRIYATVSDGKMYSVTIHLDGFSHSTCTCAKKQHCEHIAAVFFHYYAPWQRSEGLLAKRNASAKKTSPKRPSGQGKHPAPLVPATEGPVERWHEYFAHDFKRLEESKRRSLSPYSVDDDGELYFHTSLLDDFSSVISVPCKSWPSWNKALYRLHSILFFMDRLELHIKDTSLSYLDSYRIKEILEGLVQAISSILSCKQREEAQPFFQKAVAMAREHLFQGKAPLFDWLLIYRLMCVNLFHPHDWWKKETVSLEEFMLGQEKSQQGYYYAALGLASLLLVARKEEEALTLLRKLKGKRIRDMLFYLEYLAGIKEWDTLLVWLRWLAPHVKKSNPLTIAAICNACSLAAKNSDAGAEFIQLIRSWLPRSFDSYSGYLLESGLYREWAELHMSYQSHTWESLDKGVLRHLESKAPDALIPLYHQWTARLIEEKNRKAYQEAVKVLKKLRTLYNKQKMAKEWHAFISRLASHYPRMRAFQEELRKGKLISS